MTQNTNDKQDNTAKIQAKEEAYFLKKVLFIYCKFFKADNYYSLFDNRDTKIIMGFLEILDLYFDKTYTKASTLVFKLEVLEEIVDFYIKETSTKYGHEIDLESCSLVYKIDDYAIINLFNYIIEIHSDYAAAYEFLLRYKEKKLKKDIKYITSLLIEYNNFLSHILKAAKQQDNHANISRGKAHLHRSSLDAYKHILKLEKEIITRDPQVFKKFIELRKNEMGNLGKDEINEKKKNIITIYRAFSEEII